MGSGCLGFVADARSGCGEMGVALVGSCTEDHSSEEEILSNQSRKRKTL